VDLDSTPHYANLKNIYIFGFTLRMVISRPEHVGHVTVDTQQENRKDLLG
jgi:hypothetical protein